MRVACIQLRSGIDCKINLEQSIALIEQVAEQGARYILTPEMTNVVDRKTKRLLENVSAVEDATELQAYSDIARKRKIWLHIGSMAFKRSNGKLTNRAYVFSPSGDIVTQYDKIHLFDVSLENGEAWRESKLFDPGTEVNIVEAETLCVGVAICYDLRFPHLFRTLAQKGANILTLPAAFTRQTGRAHWHVLLRARAIECGAYVLAAGQGGLHEDGRETYGHSMIVSPWGEVVAELAHDEPGFIIADIDIAEVEKVRRQIPSLGLEQSFECVKVQS